MGGRKRDFQSKHSPPRPPPGRSGALRPLSPGRSGALRLLSPLRTTREPFGSCRSSLSNVPRRTRFILPYPVKPLRYSLGANSRVDKNLSVGSRTSRLLLCRHLLCLLSRFAKFSRNERPHGSQPAFAGGDVPTSIHCITPWPSLFPSSSTRSPLGLPCGSLSHQGELRAYHVPLRYHLMG